MAGMPDVEVGVNDLRRQGREVVGRHDIIPVATEEWIRVEDVDFHACVQPQHFHDTQIIRFGLSLATYDIANYGRRISYGSISLLL